MRELCADLFISLDGFASGTNEAAYFGYFGPDLGNWVQQHLKEPQVIIMRALHMRPWLDLRHRQRMK